MLAGETLPVQLTGRVIRPCRLLWLSRPALVRLLDKKADLFQHYIKHMLLCLHSSYDLSRGLAHDCVEVRIASALSSLAVKLLNHHPDDQSYEIQLTRQQLADLTGTTAETAIRTTGALRLKGILSLDKPGVIKIIDLPALRDLIE
jgi:CRP/FNR family transcriptional regulator